MRIFGRARRPSLSDDDAGALGLGPGERVLAWSPLAGGGVVAATVEGLRVVAPLGKVLRRPWTDVDHAAWDDDSRTLAVWWVGSRHPTPLEVGEGSFVPEVVHERVRASLVLSRDVVIPGGRRVWVAVRRSADGSLTTQAIAPPGLRLADPEVAALVRHAEAALRDEVGEPARHDGPV